MKLLYIDNREYGHNAELHIDFIKFMQDHKYFDIIGYGDHLVGKLRNPVRVDRKRVGRQLDGLLKRHRPDAILTYNCNGSGYEVGRDNVALYSWISDELSKVDLPKFHVTTDYCRSGFRQDQADWFDYVGYSAAFFRTGEALKFPLNIPKYLLSFSVDSSLYTRNSIFDIKKKSKKVGFIGAAHNSSRELYSNRIAAIDYLMKKNELNITKVIDKKFTRKMLFGNDYPKFWSSNLFGLTCGGTCNYMTAKYFQIPASYSMLVCSDTTGLDMFPKDTYIKYSKENLDKMYEEIIYFQNNPAKAAERINILYKHVVQKHSHAERASELLRRLRVMTK
jgi:hypothetical protein